jgi:hypothetical protein
MIGTSKPWFGELLCAGGRRDRLVVVGKIVGVDVDQIIHIMP